MITESQARAEYLKRIASFTRPQLLKLFRSMKVKAGSIKSDEELREWLWAICGRSNWKRSQS